MASQRPSPKLQHSHIAWKTRDELVDRDWLVRTSTGEIFRKAVKAAHACAMEDSPNCRNGHLHRLHRVCCNVPTATLNHKHIESQHMGGLPCKFEYSFENDAVARAADTAITRVGSRSHRHFPPGKRNHVLRKERQEVISSLSPEASSLSPEVRARRQPPIFCPSPLRWIYKGEMQQFSTSSSSLSVGNCRHKRPLPIDMRHRNLVTGRRGVEPLSSVLQGAGLDRDRRHRHQTRSCHRHQISRVSHKYRKPRRHQMSRVSHIYGTREWCDDAHRASVRCSGSLFKLVHLRTQQMLTRLFQTARSRAKNIKAKEKEEAERYERQSSAILARQTAADAGFKTTSNSVSAATSASSSPQVGSPACGGGASST